MDPAGGKDATTRTVTGLDNGVPYEFQVRATNAAGSSDPVAVAGTPKLAVPDAPGNLTASAGDGAVALTWDLPTNTSEIDNMQVAYRESGAANYLPWVDLAKDATSYDVTGLTNGTEYNFIVRALNGAGRGAEARVDATPEAGPGKVPSSPADLAATAGDTQGFAGVDPCRATTASRSTSSATPKAPVRARHRELGPTLPAATPAPPVTR